MGILSGGRPQDKGRNRKIDISMEEGGILTSNLSEKMVDVKHYYAFIEDAVADGANFIIAPDGIVGNLVFRALALLGGARVMVL